MGSTTVTRIPDTLVTLFDKEGLTIKQAFALIEQHWDSIKLGKSVSTSTPAPSKSPVSQISPTVIRNQIDLALEDATKEIVKHTVAYVLSNLYEKTEIEGVVKTKAGDRKISASLALKTQFHKEFENLIESYGPHRL